MSASIAISVGSRAGSGCCSQRPRAASRSSFRKYSNQRRLPRLLGGRALRPRVEERSHRGGCRPSHAVSTAGHCTASSSSSGGRDTPAARAWFRMSATVASVMPTDRARRNSMMLRSSVLISAPAAMHLARQRVVGHVVRQQPVNVHCAPRVGERRLERLFRNPPRELARAIRARPLRCHEHEVAGVGVPGLDLRKYRRQRRVDRAKRRRVDLVRLHPLHEHAVVGQPIGGGAVVLLREQAGDAGAIRVRRLRGDDVVAVARRQQRFARVADRDVHFRVVQDVVIDRRAGASHFQNERLQLDDVDALDRRDGAQPSGRTAGAEADDQRASRSSGA